MEGSSCFYTNAQMAKEFYPLSMSVAMKGVKAQSPPCFYYFCLCLVVLPPWLFTAYLEFQEEWYQAIIFVAMTGSHADSTALSPLKMSIEEQLVLTA